MIIAYGTGRRLETMEFLEILKTEGYKIAWAWNRAEYSKEYFINDAPQYSEYLVVDHEKKQLYFGKLLLA